MDTSKHYLINSVNLAISVQQRSDGRLIISYHSLRIKRSFRHRDLVEYQSECHSASKK